MSFLGSGPVIGEAIAPCVQGSSIPSTPNTKLPTLPSGFPTQLSSELAWTKGTFLDESSYIYNLTESDLEEINKALNRFKGE